MSDGVTSLQKELLKMRRGKADGKAKPHKPLMLLAVLDLFDAGTIRENRIHFRSDLTELFRDYFVAIAHEGDWCQPGPPFFHLRSSGFWFHKPITGHEDAYAKLTTSGGGTRRIVDNIEYAYLDDQTFTLLSDIHQREVIRSFILEAFFSPEQQEALCAVIAQHKSLTAYELGLRQNRNLLEASADYFTRNAAFRRVILEAYDFQCAACGLRIVLPDIPSPVEAAHLIPWSESHDDLPNNGIALCKLHHWALDACLLSPTLDYHWRVSNLLDDRRNSERELTRRDKLPILLPADETMRPKSGAIRWRLQHLLR